ncbi:GDP-L-fucose synthetase [hydrothermal vent metagenome]|uniref:GDP-L-fucose synthase n=1 Tax=hydrothermal vent metagenome TaxID=652676 RepID=A0A3B1B3V0_9ZZZZ
MISDKRVLVAGHSGLVGSAIVRRLQNEHCEILTLGRTDADLRRQSEVEKWMEKNRPQVVFLAAAKVGGIHANNSYPAEFLYDNLMIEANLIHAAHLYEVEKLVFLGSTCIYPKLSPQPIHESALMSGPLEPTNQWYAIAKIAGIMMCQAYRKQYSCDFISAQPTNLYGPGDNFDLENSHVLPALLRKAHEAKENDAATMSVWGSGSPLREFLYVDDLADALVFLANNYSDSEIVNIGTGQEISIAELARLVCNIVGFKGELIFDASKPDGTPRKLCDVNKLHALGWRHKVELRAGLLDSYAWYREHIVT